MNTWGYLILIAALLLLSAYMLYARFAARSREKSLHHAPSEGISFQLAPRPETNQPSVTEREIPVMDLKPRPGESEADAGESPKKKEDAYLDELQEAAAGLAMLMRSSPARDRSEPVVFAPETEDAMADGDVVSGDDQIASDRGDAVDIQPVLETLEADETELAEEESPAIEVAYEVDVADEVEIIDLEAVVDSGADVKAGVTAPTVEADSEPEKSVDSSMEEAMDQIEALLDEPPVFGEDQAGIVTGPRAEESSLEVLLGEEVASQFSRLDDGLDELEALVGEIEEQLLRFDEFISSPVEEGVSRAA